jgi:hypothetical protein
VSRLKSPLTAAKHAQRAAKKAERLRKEKRNDWLMIIGFALLFVSLVVADYFWLRAQARERREQHEKTHHRPAQTGAPADSGTGAEKTNSKAPP